MKIQGVSIVTLMSVLAWTSHFKVFNKVFYVIDKVLSGKLFHALSGFPEA